jgi:hypothetical protein
VTPLEIYAFFILPPLVLGLGFLLYWWTGREPRAR